jgi:hypothetical protein
MQKKEPGFIAKVADGFVYLFTGEERGYSNLTRWITLLLALLFVVFVGYMNR